MFGINLKNRKNYYILYTELFVLLFMIVFSIFLFYGKAPVWDRDGLTQHFPNYVYAGEWFRNIISDFLQTGKLNIVEWDPTIGLGQDVFNVVSFRLSYLFAVFATEKTLVIYLWVVIAVALYGAGIAFSEYCFYLKANRFSTLVATLLYVFSSYSLVYAPKHYMFIGFLIFLPMMSLGIEKIINENKKAVLFWGAFLSAWTYFYIFYIVAVFAMLYYVLRFVMRKEKNVKLFFKEVGICAATGITAFLLAAASWLRVIVLSLESGRYGSELEYDYTSMWHYFGNYYVGFIKNIFSTDIFNSALILGFSSIAGICVICVFLSPKRKYGVLKVGTLAIVLLMMTPFGSYFFNAFSGKNDRWSCILTFWTSVIVAQFLPKVLKLDKKNITKIFCVGIGYMLLIYIIQFMGFEVGFEVSFSILLINVFLVWKLLKPDLENKRLVKVVVLVAVLLDFLVKSLSLYTPMNNNYLSQFHDLDNIVDKVEGVYAQALDGYEDTDVYRVDEVREEFTERLLASNYGLRAGVNGLSASYSYITRDIQKFVNDTGVGAQQSVSFMVIGFMNRTILNTLSSVKYAVTQDLETGYMPFGYELVETTEIVDEYGETAEAYIFENKYFLPYIYASDYAIEEKTYEELNAVEKEAALLEGIVLEETGEYPIAQIESCTQELMNHSEIVEQLQGKYEEIERVFVSEGKIEVPKDGTYVQLTFSGVPNAETHILFEGLEFIPQNPLNYEETRLGENASLWEQFRYGDQARIWSMPGYTRLGYGNQTLILNTEISQYYAGPQDAVINVGYSESGINSAILYFSRAGTYSFENVQVVAYPMDKYVEKIEKLRTNVAENIVLEDNIISGDITLPSEKYVCINVPYSEGWKAYINGEETELYKANGMYMAVYVKEGENHIELVYHNRGLRPGFAISGITFMGVMIWFGVKKYIKKRRGIIQNG